MKRAADDTAPGEVKRAKAALPDEADSAEAAYFGLDADSTNQPPESTDQPPITDPPPTVNGHPPPPANGAHPNSVDSAAEPDERADALEAYMAQISAQQGALANRPQPETNSRCVMLENMLTVATASDPEELHVTRMETGHECSRWGTLLRVHAVAAFDEDLQPVPENVAGRIFVEFEEPDAAAECARAMDGRYFDGRRVSATFYPVEAFLNGEFSLEGAEVRQTAITWEDIVAMNSRPASSWDTMSTAAGTANSESANPHAPNGDNGTAGNGAAGEAMEVEASAADGGASLDGDGTAASAPAEDEPANFHAEFMRQMRAQAAEAARQAAHASQELLEGRDDAMDALVEEFPDAAEGVAAASDSDDSEAREDSLLAARAKKKELPMVDHATIEYAPFRKSFYIEVPEIKNMSEEEVEALRKELDSVKVRGKRVPRPIKRWTQAGLSDRVLTAIERAGYTKPFPIQAQTLPAVMSGRDVIAIAKTGSGKTMGYTLPMLRHVMDQPPLAAGDGPIGLVMVPTRELAMQVYREVSKFAKVVGLAVAAVYGGANLKQQIAELKRGTEMVVCTPGRMIDMLAANSGRVTNLRRVTYVVLDEADRMFDMGFAPQIDRIVGNIRPDRQTMLFSATFPQAVEKLARGVLTKPVQIIVGGISVVSNTIEQHVEVLPPEGKLPRLCQLLRQHYDEGQQLVFVDTQEACDALFKELLKNHLPCATLHGGMGQDDRDSTIADFKSGNIGLLVATSVAARGLDVKGLVCVINYEVPNHYEDYVHRVGRTGRAGQSGVAYTFLTPEEDKFAPDLVKAMEAAGQEPPDDVVCMANAYQEKRQRGELKTKDFRTSGFKSGKGIALDADSLAKEEKAKRDKRKREQRAAGVTVGDEDSDDDDDAAVKQVGGASEDASAGASSGGPPMDAALSVAQAAAQAAKALQLRIGNKQGANDAAAEVQRRLLDASKTALSTPAAAETSSSSGGASGTAAPAATTAAATTATAAASGGVVPANSVAAAASAAGATTSFAFGAGRASLNPAQLAAAAAMASKTLSACSGGAAAAGAAAATGATPPSGAGVGTAGAAPIQAAVPQPSIIDHQRAAAEAANNARMSALPLATQQALKAAAERANLAAQRRQEEAAEKLRQAQEMAMAKTAQRTRFQAELEINDYPQTARFKVMNREVISGIQEFTKTAIITKGQYYAPGRNPPAGERKLYFFIEGETEAAVKAARKELRRALDEHAAIAAPAEEGKYTKYRL